MKVAGLVCFSSRRRDIFTIRELTPRLIGVLLLDPAVTEGYPLWGGYGSFGCPPSLRAGRVATEVSPQSLYEAFTNWATSLKPEELETTASDPAFLTSRLYLHICSEWLIVMEYATTRLSHIEWELEKTQWRGPLGLEETLSKLQPWQRRIPIYMSFIKATKYELECRQNSSLVPKVHWEDITADIDGIYERVQTLQTRVDKIMNVATAITSIEESKKAMKEARDVTRITYLAFVFVPMSFTASFLSMNQTFPSSNRVYWVFFVIALPLSTAAVLIAANWTSFEKWWKDRRQKR
jgi:Mg2+ and Co2+ transporter CorA